MVQDILWEFEKASGRGGREDGGWGGREDGGGGEEGEEREVMFRRAELVL